MSHQAASPSLPALRVVGGDVGTGIFPYEHLNVAPGRGQVGYEITLGLNSA